MRRFRRRTTPAPRPTTLGALPLHVVVRDYPETLSTLRGLGIDPRVTGAAPIGAADDADAVRAALLSATSWRPRP